MTDLTTLSAAKAWANIQVGDSDTVLASLITAVSAAILNYTGRASFLTSTVTEIYDGNGREWLLLRQWPVQSITSINFDATAITAASTGFPPSNGYQLENPLPGTGAQRLTLYGYCFPKGRGNVQITYQAGYSAVPADVAQACNELVGEAFARRSRPGQVSKTLGGQETVAFSQADIPAKVKLDLMRYIPKVPF